MPTKGSFHKKLPAISQEGNKLKEIHYDFTIYPSNTCGETLDNVSQVYNLFFCKSGMTAKICIKLLHVMCSLSFHGLQTARHTHIFPCYCLPRHNSNFSHFSEQLSHNMTNYISDIELSNLIGKSTEQSMEDSTPSDANPACEQDNNIDLKQIEELPKAEVLHCQQDKNQWETREELYTTMEIFHTMIKMLNHIFTILTEARNHIASQQRSTLYYAERRICFNCRKPGHIARDCRANKALFSRNQREVYGRRFNIQQTTINQKSSHLQYEHPSSQGYTRHHNVQKQRLDKNQCFLSQTIPIFLQQHNVRSPEFQTNEPNSS